MRTKKSKIAATVGISGRHLAYILAGARNAAPRTAVALHAATGISRDIWVFGTAEQRREAWERYVASEMEARP